MSETLKRPPLEERIFAAEDKLLGAINSGDHQIQISVIQDNSLGDLRIDSDGKWYLVAAMRGFFISERSDNDSHIDNLLFMHAQIQNTGELLYTPNDPVLSLIKHFENPPAKLQKDVEQIEEIKKFVSENRDRLGEEFIALLEEKSNNLQK